MLLELDRFCRFEDACVIRGIMVVTRDIMPVVLHTFCDFILSQVLTRMSIVQVC